MGGNVTGINKRSGEQLRAEKIPIKDIGRSNFTKKFISIFKEINVLYKKAYGKPLWVNEKNIENGLQFNGSTSFIFNGDIPDEEIVKYKTHAGDLDIIVPDDTKGNVWRLLDKLEGETILKGVEYIGSNKETVSSIGEQINSVFRVDFGGGLIVAAQVDWEFLEMEDDIGTPSQWAKFSHSSSFDDAKAGIKALHHKYLIQSIIGGASIRDDIVIATPSSTPDKIKISGNKTDTLPRMLKFSVGRGIRTAYDPMYNENGEPIFLDGKQVYKARDSKTDVYVTIVKEIYKLAFGRLEDSPTDVEKFGSFVGIIELMHSYLDKTQIQHTTLRYEEKLFDKFAQVIERGDPKGDFEVKIAGYAYYCKSFGVKQNQKIIDAYYSNFPDRDKDSIFTEALRRIL